nr:glycosyltransferase family 39 protein [uncultured Massilia sp.]
MHPNPEPHFREFDGTAGARPYRGAPSATVPRRAGEALRSKRVFWLLALAFVLVSLYALGIRTLVPPDEGRYAEMAREMFASGDWITTRLNGIKYFEKPPLQAWMTALAFTVFGVGEWQARLWTGVSGLLGVGLSGFAAWRLFGPRVGGYSALVLASSLYWIVGSQVNSLDMGLSAMMTLALCALLLAQRDEAGAAERRNWMLVCWAGMALAVLSKGLIGIVLPGGVLVVYTLLAGDRRIWTRLYPGRGLAVFLLIAAPWFVLVGLRNPEQPHFFFIHEHVERFLLKEHHREAAWWIFFALLAVGSIPWLGVLVQSLAAAARRRPGVFQPRLLLLVWVAFITLFFTKSNSKLPGYILPVFPAVAMLVGDHLAAARPRWLALNAGILGVLGVALLGVAPFVTQFSKRASEVAQFGACEPWIICAAIAALTGCLLALYYVVTERRDQMVLSLAVAGFIGTQLLLAGFEPIAQLRAGTELLPAMRAALAPATRVYSVGLYEQSLTFYLGRPVALVDYRDEFDFGLQQEPTLALPGIAQFAGRWHDDGADGRPALAIVRNDLVPVLQRQGVRMRIVAADARRTVIANR